MGRGLENGPELPFQVLLDAMEGVSYIVDRDRRLLCCGRRNWSCFARENGGAGIADPGSVIGRSILDFVGGDDVIAAYRGYMSELFDGAIEAVAFEFRCDAPDMRRDLWMTIRPLEADGRIDALLFQSITVRELTRPVLGIFDFEALRAHASNRQSLPIVTLCAYCARVATAAAGDDERKWVSAETYYQNGGTSEVRLSHGICGSCHDRYVAALLAAET